MKKLLKYRDTDYYNTNDYFIIYIDSLKKYHVTKLQLYNGTYYSLLGLEYKMTSILSINYKELIGLTVTYMGTEIKGKLMNPDKVINDNVGVFWESGKNINTYGLPHFWNKIEKLEV